MSNLETPFLNNAQNNIGCAQMSEGAYDELAWAIAWDSDEDKVPQMEFLRENKITVIEIILKRLEVLNLPIKFTPGGLIGAFAMTEGNPGRGVTLLIDCLTKHEGKTINASMLADMYPFGFYNEETFTDYVDNYLRNIEVRNQIKWAEIY